jgi:hypothetical protein
MPEALTALVTQYIYKDIYTGILYTANLVFSRT